VSRQGASSRGWWRAYFDDTYHALHASLFPPETTRREVAGIIELLGLPLGARVLDIPCGWGRHTGLLRAAGYEAFGADYSWPQLRRAKMSGRSGLKGRLAAADLRALPFSDHTFEAVVNVFTSLGLLGSDREDIRALREARRVLVPGGRLLLETMHRDEIMGAYAERDTWRLPDGTRVRAERSFDPVEGMSHEVLYWSRKGESGEKRQSLRLRTATEIAGLLRRAGFRRTEWFGGWGGEPLHYRSASLIVIATRPVSRLPERTGKP
jgi:SAM-dependent methyltransferase